MIPREVKYSGLRTKQKCWTIYIFVRVLKNYAVRVRWVALYEAQLEIVRPCVSSNGAHK